MSVHVDIDPPETVSVAAELEKMFTVFEGSSPADCCHARQLWSSVSLSPPLESRLVSAHIRQRMPVCRPGKGPGVGAVVVVEPKTDESGQIKRPCSVDDGAADWRSERARYENMADMRREILALLKRQRESRIHREMLANAVKTKPNNNNNNKKNMEKGRDKLFPRHPDTEVDEALVKQLQ